MHVHVAKTRITEFGCNYDIGLNFQIRKCCVLNKCVKEITEPITFHII